MSQYSAFISAYYSLLSCGIILNITVVFVMLRSGKMRQNISSFLIFHLSLTHLFYLTTSMFPFFAYSSSHASCIATVLITRACAAAIFNSLVAIAWDRQRNVLRPFKSLAPRHLKTYLMLVAAIWTYAFVTSAPFIYSVRIKSVETCSKENNGTGKCREYSFCHLPSDGKTQLSRTVYFLLAFVFPLMYMVFTYTNIAVSLWKRSKTGIIHGAVAKCKVKSTRLMVVAVLGFVFCWGPTFWVDLLTVYGAIQEYSFLLVIWYRITQISSSCINPAIYAFFSPEFRKLFVRFCCCGCSCRGCARRGLPERRNRVQPVMLTGQAAN